MKQERSFAGSTKPSGREPALSRSSPAGRWGYVPLATCAFLFLVSASSAAVRLDPQSVESAEWRPQQSDSTALLVKAQVLLDRDRFSPGEIDGRNGDNFRKAIVAFAAAKGIASTGDINEDTWRELAGAGGEPVLRRYRIEDGDVRGPFARRIPHGLKAMSKLPRLSYKSAREALAEKFHMSERLLQALNPGEAFNDAGHEIIVANVRTDNQLDKASRIEVDKGAKVLRVFGRDGGLLAIDPASIGSEEKPAPSGTLHVVRVTFNPTYRYDPRYQFKGVHAKRPFTIRPGPNNPVGVVWIGLSRKGYGIHGTPDPGAVSKTQSHGCIRLTNWDALTLASAVSKGNPVDFIEATPKPSDQESDSGR